MSAFHNCNNNNPINHFFIGINDHSEITGIPFKGNLRIYNRYFEKCIHNAVRNYVPDICCMSTEITVIKNEIDTDLLNNHNLDELLQTNENKKRAYEDSYAQYTREKKKWINDIFVYKGCLEDLINHETIKLDFIKFLESTNLLHSFPEVLVLIRYTWI